jgi:hypothetical protein
MVRVGLAMMQVSQELDANGLGRQTYGLGTCQPCVLQGIFDQRLPFNVINGCRFTSIQRGGYRDQARRLPRSSAAATAIKRCG